jgi:hypothetical protein
MGRYWYGASNKIEAFLAIGTIAVYGNANNNPGVYAGYFKGNVTVTQNLSVDSNICLGGVCRNTWPAGGGGGGGVNGSGVSGRIAVWNDTDKINSSSSLVWDFANSRMGVNTNSPQAALDVQGGTVVGNASGSGSLVANTGIYGTGSTYGLYGRYDTNNYGYVGNANTGVFGQGSAYGVFGYSSASFGVYGESASSYGVFGLGSPAVYGQYDPSDYGYLGSSTIGAYGAGSTAGVVGNRSGAGVPVSGSGVYGTGSAYGVYGKYNDSVYGYMGSSEGYGVRGNGTEYGVYGTSSNLGVLGLGGATGVAGQGSTYGVLGLSSSDPSNNQGYLGGPGVGVFGKGSSYAGYFQGNVTVTDVGIDMIFFDSTNKRIGVNTSTPEYAIDVRGGTIAANASGSSAQMAILGAFNSSIGGYIGGPNKAGVFLNMNPSAATMYGIYTITNGTGTGKRYGVYSNASNGNENYGVYATSSGGTNSYGIYAKGDTAAGYFAGNVTVTGNLTVGTGTVFIDGTNSRVGIGTLNPQSGLSVGGEGYSGYGIFGNGSSEGVHGEGPDFGVLGVGGYGVSGHAADGGTAGVRGWYNGSNYVLLAEYEGYGVLAYGTTVGVVGNRGGSGVPIDGSGVYGTGSIYGVYGYYDPQTSGMLGGQNGAGVEGHGSAYGIYGASGAGYAGFFDGKVWVGGGLNVTGLFQLQNTDAPAACSSASEGSVYYDASLNEPCFCNGAAWTQFDGGGGC